MRVNLNEFCCGNFIKPTLRQGGGAGGHMGVLALSRTLAAQRFMMMVLPFPLILSLEFLIVILPNI